MQTSNVNQNFSSDDPVWVLLVEISLGDFLSDHVQSDSPTAGLLLQTARELGMSPECKEGMAATLARFAKEVLTRTKQERLEFPGWIRIFCQKKMIDDANAENLFHTEQGSKQKQIFPDSAVNTTGGWGYFIIERCEDLPAYSSTIPHNYIDLYLYKEGE